ncbi:MAG: DUF1844 domain-containing protein [Deltaproteobacteria bacterium]|nr:DUF1844 domain-containing protein [Deltaproteobacteria bacterium]MBW1993168.1 DUF1844 domain-containing protein [Deltaproteobacteria bacterium]MBW2151822.1 DUF1844 domain-containing protein [Deltaproteobacteria bacterium]
MSEEEKGFIIKDRRIFSETAEKAEKKEESKAAEERKEHKEATRKEKSSAEKRKEPPPLPEINFQTFVFSLNASALVQLGVMEDPATGKREKNLPLAKQTIDMLSMLQNKTAGNLTKEEDELLKNILYDLRLRYVKEKG